MREAKIAAMAMMLVLGACGGGGGGSQAAPGGGSPDAGSSGATSCSVSISGAASSTLSCSTAQAQLLPTGALGFSLLGSGSAGDLFTLLADYPGVSAPAAGAYTLATAASESAMTYSKGAPVAVWLASNAGSASAGSMTLTITGSTALAAGAWTVHGTLIGAMVNTKDGSVANVNGTF